MGKYNIKSMFQISGFKFQDARGQSLIEIIIAMVVGAILIGAAVTAIVPMLRSNLETKNIQIATSLNQEYLDNIRNLAEFNWFNVYNPPSAKGPNSQFYLRATTTTYEIISGTTSTVIEGRTFTQYFSIEDVNRNLCGSGDITTASVTACLSGPGVAGVSNDPSTQKITAIVNWPTNRSISRIEYLTRNSNKVFNQSDWSGGPGQEGPITVENNKFATSTGSDYGGLIGSATIQGLSTSSSPDSGTNIDYIYRYAWNDVIGWIDFYSTGNVMITASQLFGYATSSVGYIALDCSTSPNGNICGSSNFKVLNDGSGNLSGWAWNDAIGWISFDSVTAGSPFSYQVKILPNGRSREWAWNDVVGWISFSCANTNTCGDSRYEIRATSSIPSEVPIIATLTSSIFDTQATSGVALNSLTWQGIQPLGTAVTFQISSSNSASGPWNYVGPDGSSSTYYTPAGPGLPIQINLQYHNNQRYFRYKIFLYSDYNQTVSPQVINVIINWST